jgi:hypothetical protein
MLDSSDPFVKLINAQLDRFEAEVIDDEHHSKVVYAVLVQQIFLRAIEKHGTGTFGHIMLRNLYRVFYRVEIAQSKAKAADLARQQASGGSSVSPLPPLSPGDPPGLRPFPDNS